jgi:hypothetical protein
MGTLLNKPLRVEKLEKMSGFTPRLLGHIPCVKKKHYRILANVSVGGDAPKELIRYYKYKQGKQQRSNPHSWDLYIAKTGHKWYPYESITEYLLNKIGSCFDLKMAEASLANINSQIRFLSRFFLLEKTQLLEHGAELYGGYLNDRDFVEHIEQENKARDFFTVSLTRNTFQYLYPRQSEDLFISFLKMLVFDAIIGNNDRHFYNWGIVKHIRDLHQPFFAPVFDTARALCWHTPEDKIEELSRNHHMRRAFLNKYIQNSRPKTGIESQTIKNHFDLIAALNKGAFDQTKSIIPDFINRTNQKKCNELLMDEMRYLMSEQRLQIVSDCLNLRFTRLFEIIR